MGGQAMGDPLMVMADRPTGVQATGVQQPIRLARSSIPAGLTDALIQKVTETMSAASAKISAIRHRCCLALPDVRHGSVDP
jgi:hypothetical protein